MINVFLCEHVESNHEYACNMQTFILHLFGSLGFIFVGRVQNLILHPILNPFSFNRVHFYEKGANSYFAPFFAPFFLRVYVTLNIIVLMDLPAT